MSIPDMNVNMPTPDETMKHMEFLLSAVEKLASTLPPEFCRAFADVVEKEDSLQFHIDSGINAIRDMRRVYAKLDALSEQGECNDSKINFCDKCRALVEHVITLAGINVCEECHTKKDDDLD